MLRSRTESEFEILCDLCYEEFGYVKNEGKLFTSTDLKYTIPEELNENKWIIEQGTVLGKAIDRHICPECK